MIRSFAAGSVFAAFLATLSLGAAGCGDPPNFLDGSIKTSHDLTFDSVELRYLSDQAVYQLSYFKILDEEAGAAGGQDTVVKLTFNEPEGGVKVDQEISLVDPATEARVERVTSKNDPFPTGLDKGSVTFHSKATVGETVTGEFAVTFANGKTLNGDFEDELEAVSF